MTFLSPNKFHQGIYLFIFLFFAIPPAVYSQTSLNLLNLAKNYEEDGLYEKAVPIYEELYKKDPTNIVVLDRLKNVYRVLSKHDSLLQVITNQLQKDSVNIALLCELADALYKSKNIPIAQSIVQKIVALDPGSESTYRLVITVLMGNRRFDEVEQTYRTARKNLANDKLFILELASLLVYKNDYYLAAKEFLRYYNLNPGSQDYVKTQILQFPNNSKDNQSIIKAVRENLESNKEDYALNKFLIDVLIKNQNYESAFEQSKLLDTKRGKNGAEILRFANMMFDNRQFGISQEAYAYFLTLYPNAPQAEMGIAKCFESMGSTDILISAQSDTASFKQKIKENISTDRAIQAYQTLIAKYPNSEWSAEAYFHIGEIKLRKFFDVQEAFVNFSKAVDSKNPFRIESMFRLGECYLTEGRLDKSLTQYTMINAETRDAATCDRALFLEAEIYFFMEQFDSCFSRMKSLSRSQNGLYVNDALSYMLLIQENLKEIHLLTMYAKADLYFVQKKYSEALALLSEIIHVSPNAAIVDDALLKTAGIYSMSGRYAEAISVYRNIVDNLKNSTLADLALKKIGETFEEKLETPAEAIKAYRELLSRYPNSIYVNQVRKRMRELEQTAKKSS
ncbi:tetratricopeptide repeat protein [bacterium]|nr:tetratricopeptide repeat protein [bacterium]